MHTVCPFFESACVEYFWVFISLYWWSTDAVISETNLSTNTYVSDMKILNVSLPALLHQQLQAIA